MLRDYALLYFCHCCATTLHSISIIASATFTIARGFDKIRVANPFSTNHHTTNICHCYALDSAFFAKSNAWQSTPIVIVKICVSKFVAIYTCAVIARKIARFFVAIQIFLSIVAAFLKPSDEKAILDSSESCNDDLLDFSV
ncbi:hypothetical protein [Helicobacter sp. T3_23-1056]